MAPRTDPTAEESAAKACQLRDYGADVRAIDADRYGDKAGQAETRYFQDPRILYDHSYRL